MSFLFFHQNRYVGEFRSPSYDATRSVAYFCAMCGDIFARRVASNQTLEFKDRIPASMEAIWGVQHGFCAACLHKYKPSDRLAYVEFVDLNERNRCWEPVALLAEQFLYEAEAAFGAPI